MSKFLNNQNMPDHHFAQYDSSTMVGTTNPLHHARSGSATDSLMAIRGTSTFTNTAEFFLLIRGVIEHVLLYEKEKVQVGRSDPANNFYPDIDMTRYGGRDRGVSRLHACFHVDGDNLFITDLGSSNGTFLAGHQLQPHVPTLIRKNDELRFGTLPTKVLFK
jgi:hypothetical protein